MKVLTIDFNESCVLLASKVNLIYQPQIIVGIATGGQYVAQILSREMNIPLVIVKKQRPMTRVKNKIRLDVILKKIPYAVTNLLRVLETKFNEYMYEKNKLHMPHNNTPVEWVTGDFTRLREYRKILIVDDSIDSGNTLSIVKDFIARNMDDDVEVKTAVLNQTFKNPLIKPDFLLDANVIYRFPWSNDTKKII